MFRGFFLVYYVLTFGPFSLAGLGNSFLAAEHVGVGKMLWPRIDRRV